MIIGAKGVVHQFGSCHLGAGLILLSSSRVPHYIDIEKSIYMSKFHPKATKKVPNCFLLWQSYSSMRVGVGVQWLLGLR